MQPNPFIYGGPIYDLCRFIDRSQETDLILDRLRNPARLASASIIGDMQIGKASLLGSLEKLIELTMILSI